jgi:hypothetical protein
MNEDNLRFSERVKAFEDRKKTLAALKDNS